ncbi:WSSV195 [White spot syndrome virus]|uniref:WSSV195 n=1 Tax=White spot syndrome virus TaxID=342409 RepID=A0A2I6SBT2_9VIRU|nr:WSSV195 [White spot syndrome virus]
MDAIDEEAREEYGNEIGRIGDKSTCLVFALSARDFFLTNRFNEDTPIFWYRKRNQIHVFKLLYNER